MAKIPVTIEAPISGLFTSIRGFKYSFHEAVADIVDNSIDADAGRVDIFIEKGVRVLIVDDGQGMEADDLVKAITPWGNAGVKSRSSKDKKGKYGIGLKSAGFSLGDKIIVHTKKSKGEFYTATLDLEELKKNKGNEFTIIEGEVTKTWEQHGLKKGTIVEIQGLNDRKINSSAIESLSNRLGVSFFGMLEEKTLLITINKTPVESKHPLLNGLAKNSKNNRYNSFRSKTIKLKTENGSEASFKLTAAYIGRGFFWNDKESKEYRWWLSSKFKDKVKIDDQGLYISRNGRLITHGGWYKTRPLSHHNSPFRVLIEYHTVGDGLVGVDHTKTKPELEEHFIDIINAKYINEAFLEAEALYRSEGKDMEKFKQKRYADKELKTKTLPKPSSVDSMMDKDERRKSYYPEYEQEQEELDDEIEEELEDEWIKFVERLPYDNMWQPMLNKDGDATCVFSDTHPGYGALYYQDDPDDLRRHLNTFFLTLSAYELDFVNLSTKLTPRMKEELKKQFEAFRRYVSKHFRDFE